MRPGLARKLPCVDSGSRMATGSSPRRSEQGCGAGRGDAHMGWLPARRRELDGAEWHSCAWRNAHAGTREEEGRGRGVTLGCWGAVGALGFARGGRTAADDKGARTAGGGARCAPWCDSGGVRKRISRRSSGQRKGIGNHSAVANFIVASDRLVGISLPSMAALCSSSGRYVERHGGRVRQCRWLALGWRPGPGSTRRREEEGDGHRCCDRAVRAEASGAGQRGFVPQR